MRRNILLTYSFAIHNFTLFSVQNWNLYRLTDWRLTNRPTWQDTTQYVEFRKIIPLININQTFISQTLQVKNGVKDPSWIHFYLLPMYANTSQQRICLWPCPPPHEDVFGQFYTIVYNISMTWPFHLNLTLYKSVQ